jgi:zinc-finger of transposase IS204/IS1001/IS1096/IS1165
VLLQRLLPHLTGFRLLAHHRIEGVLYLDLSAQQCSAACPSCQHRSRAVHSYYRRTVADVPLGGAKTRLRLHVRRFFCRYANCPQRIFTEQFPTLVLVRGRHSRGVCAAFTWAWPALAGARGAGAPAGATDGGAIPRPTAVRDRRPVQVSPSYACAPLGRGSGREPSCSSNCPPSGTPVSLNAAGSTSK